MKLFPTSDETIQGVSERLRAGQVRCAAVLEQCLEKINQLEAQVHAWVRLDGEAARAQARQLDDELAAGRWRGPLHGIPVGIKDLIDVRGWATMAGWPRWADRIARRDAT